MFPFLAAVSGAMEGGPGNDTSTPASSPLANSQTPDSVIASYKELIKEQVGILTDNLGLFALPDTKFLFKIFSRIFFLPKFRTRNWEKSERDVESWKPTILRFFMV